ncbi:TOMM precursor leader peptide-binding protein [[Actinomadura] parvosata]|uniref:TOMM precursor leader peptide-binding protein n=1 Tax=[Actinomadura] parvosata TaxID=1955412 RepID=UPI00406D3E46
MRDVALIGRGILCDAIAEELDGWSVRRYATAEHVSGAPALMIAADDSWNTARTAEVREAATDLGISWLRVRAELGRVVIGPFETPGQAGCVSCAERRRRRARTDQAGHRAIWQRHRTALRERPSPWLTSLGAAVVAELVAAEAALLSEGGRAPHTRRAFFVVNLERLDVSLHAFLPDAFCGTCGDAPTDSAELARLSLAPRSMHRAGSLRTREVSGELPELESLYVDAECGVIGELADWTAGGLAVTSARVSARGGGEVSGYGRAHTRAASRLVALLEGLERYGGAPGARRTVVHASYAEVADNALDPRTLGLYPPERYRLPGFGYRPFHPAEPCDWVWGYSFARKEPILVPKSCAFYQHGDTADHDRGLVYEISNGCALGGSLEEAILHAILEVAERDAFLLTWYCRLPAPRIDVGAAVDRRLPLWHAALEADSGYMVALHDISVEQGIPCVWAMAVNPREDGRPATVSAAGSSLDPERAIANALAELAPDIEPLADRYTREADRAQQMLADPRLVRDMDDHSLLYAHPAASRRLSFLTGSTGVRKPADMGAFDGADLTRALAETVRRYVDTGLDVIVIDQTGSEHRAGGFACVKVLIPGTLSMTFGHDNRRVDGLPRLLTMPRLLGYRARDLAPGELNLDPHPFP